MSRLKLDIVTGERTVYSAEADVVVAPGIEGELAILPMHASLMTMLQPGEMRVIADGGEIHMAVSGGFLEVSGNHVVVLADTAEHSEEIDENRAEAARQKAVSFIQQRGAQCSPDELVAAAAALRRSQIRLRVSRRRRREASRQQ
jgi:F-type H+-transporting ATPase subunit epsilon